jgi:ankyrin repeat protein
MGCLSSKPEDVTNAKGNGADVPSRPVSNPEVAVPVKKELDFKPIHSAVRWNKPINEVKELLVSEEAVNCVDVGNGNSPIHIAAQNGKLIQNENLYYFSCFKN